MICLCLRSTSQSCWWSSCMLAYPTFLYRYQAGDSRQRLQILKREQEVRELRGCTFSPVLNINTRKARSSAQGPRGPHNYLRSTSTSSARELVRKRSADNIRGERRASRANRYIYSCCATYSSSAGLLTDLCLLHTAMNLGVVLKMLIDRRGLHMAMPSPR